MEKKSSIILISIISILVIYEMFSSRTSMFLLLLGFLLIIIRKKFLKEYQNIILLTGVISLILAFILSRTVLILLLLFLFVFWGNHPDLFEYIYKQLTQINKDTARSEFIMVDFEQIKNQNFSISKNPWINLENERNDSIYSWEDVNYTTLAKNTIFDLGNTILPKEQNMIVIRKAFGNTKIIIPEDIAISLDISLLLGDVIIDGKKISLKNENFKWQSDDYKIKSRKIKLITNHLFGEIEVIFT